VFMVSVNILVDTFRQTKSGAQSPAK